MVSSSSTAPKTLKSHFAMSVLGTGPKWRSGQRSGAVSVWPGGMRAGSTPSGMRLLLKSEATSGEYRKRRVYSHFSALRELCGPVAQLGARLNRTQEVRGSNPLGSTNRMQINSAPVGGLQSTRLAQRRGGTLSSSGLVI